jgi:hypothetical protein
MDLAKILSTLIGLAVILAPIIIYLGRTPHRYRKIDQLSGTLTWLFFVITFLLSGQSFPSIKPYVPTLFLSLIVAASAVA